jgi:hypothetical protein
MFRFQTTVASRVPVPDSEPQTFGLNVRVSRQVLAIPTFFKFFNTVLLGPSLFFGHTQHNFLFWTSFLFQQQEMVKISFSPGSQVLNLKKMPWHCC